MTTREQAIAAAGAILARARRERDELAAAGGPEAVGEAAHPRDPEKAAEAAATYARWQAEERAKRERGAA